MDLGDIVTRQKASTSVLEVAKRRADLIARRMIELFGEESGPATAVLLDRALERLENDTKRMIRAEVFHSSVQTSEEEFTGSKDAMLAVRDAVEQYDRIFSKTSTLLQALLEIVGEAELAGTLSTSGRSVKPNLGARLLKGRRKTPKAV